MAQVQSSAAAEGCDGQQWEDWGLRNHLNIEMILLVNACICIHICIFSYLTMIILCSSKALDHPSCIAVSIPVKHAHNTEQD